MLIIYSDHIIGKVKVWITEVCDNKMYTKDLKFAISYS